MKRGGFTLIELLVVLGIITVLASILFPVFAQAREMSRKTVCLSNEKQIAMAVLQYTQDYDEALPLILTPILGTDPTAYGPQHNQYAWQNLVLPYVKNWQVFICPDSGATNSNPALSIDPFNNYGIFARAADNGLQSYQDYWWNRSWAIWDGLGGENGVPSSTLSMVYDTSSMSLINEVGGFSGFTNGGAPDPSDGCIYELFQPPYNLAYLHDYLIYREAGPIGNHNINGSGSNNKWCWQWQSTETDVFTNVAFVDGHCKSLSLQAYMGIRTNGSGQPVLKYLWPGE